MKHTLRDLAEKLGCPLLGDSSITVTKVSSLQSAKSDSLVFVDDAQHLDAALRSSAAAVIAGDFAAGNVAASTTKPILISAHPRPPHRRTRHQPRPRGPRHLPPHDRHRKPRPRRLPPPRPARHPRRPRPRLHPLPP